MFNTMLVLAFCVFLFGETAMSWNKMGLGGVTPQEVVGRKCIRCGRRLVRYEILKYECCHTCCTFVHILYYETTPYNFPTGSICQTKKFWKRVNLSQTQWAVR